jgi:hypothetical protein
VSAISDQDPKKYAGKLEKLKGLATDLAGLDEEVRGEAFSALAPDAVSVSETSRWARFKKWAKSFGSFLEDLGKPLALIVAVVGGITAIITLWWLIDPNREPVTEESFSISDVTVSRQVTLAEFAQRRFLRNLISQAWEFPPAGDPESQVVGTTVDFNVSLKGFPRKELAFRWTLFDATTRDPVAESEDIDPFCLYHGTNTTDRQLIFPCVRHLAVLRDNDISSFAFWIDTRNQSAPCFFVRVEGFDRFARVVFKDSPNFPPPTAPDASTGCPAAKETS